MHDILKSISKLSIPTAISFVNSFVKNKLLAIIVGPAGLGIYSQLMTLSTLFTSVFPFGSMGIVKYVSSYFHDARYREINSLLTYFIKRNLIYSFICVLLLLFFYGKISDLLFADSSYGNLLFLFSIFIPLSLVLNFIDIYFRGIRQINKYVLFLSLNSISSVVISVPLIIYLGLEGAVLSLILSAFVNFLIGLIILKRERLLPNLRDSQPTEKLTVYNVYKLGFAAVTTMLAQQISFLLIKSLIASRLGLSSVGMFQCVFSISYGYFGIFYSLLITYSLPKVSTFKHITEINKELNNTFKFLLLLFTPLILTIFTTRTLVIKILFTSEFLNAKNLLILQLPAEFVRAISWVFGLWLIPNLKIKQWVAFDLIYYFLFFILFYVMEEWFGMGLEAASIAYLSAYVVFCLINLIYTMYSIKFRFEKINLKIFVFSVFLIFLSFFISYINENLGFYALFPVLISWLLIVFKKEDLTKLKILLKLKVPKNL